MIEIPKIRFDYAIPASITLSIPLIRKTLKEVQAQLLSRDINGGSKKLHMDNITDTVNTCGMAACIGGWTSLFLLGFDKTRDLRLENSADELFELLITFDRDAGTGQLNNLFYGYTDTENYDEPNVAATAIKRYLAGNDRPWPHGQMPNVMPYTKRARRKT